MPDRLSRQVPWWNLVRPLNQTQLSPVCTLAKVLKGVTPSKQGRNGAGRHPRRVENAAKDVDFGVERRSGADSEATDDK